MCAPDVLELPLQPSHVDHKNIFIQIETVIPQLFQKLILSDDFLTVHKEIIQDAEFIPRELCLPVVVPDRGQMQIKRAFLFRDLAEIAGVSQPESPPNLLKEDQRVIWLGDKVDASRPDAHKLICRSVPAGDEDDRRLSFRADLLADVISILVGKVDVQKADLQDLQNYLTVSSHIRGWRAAGRAPGGWCRCLLRSRSSWKSALLAIPAVSLLLYHVSCMFLLKSTYVAIK